jgi:hypothetical protein
VLCEQTDELLQQTQQAEAAEGTAAATTTTGGVLDRAAFAVALLNRVRAQCSPFLQAEEPEPSQRPTDERDAEAEGQQPGAPPATTSTQSITAGSRVVGNDRERRSIHAAPVPLPAEFPPLVRSASPACPATQKIRNPFTHARTWA